MSIPAESYWQRPGKEGQGSSATTNHDGHDILYVFSTSTMFEAQRGYSKFHAYALLHHQGDFEERLNREQNPLFLLALPGNVAPLRQPDEADEQYQARRDATVNSYLAAQHFAFLDRRAPWAMSMEWADFLWKRGRARQEIGALKTWFYSAAQRREEEEGQPIGDEEQTRPCLPLFETAWLCRPDITRLQVDLKRALQSGDISNLRTSTVDASADRTPDALPV